MSTTHLSVHDRQWSAHVAAHAKPPERWTTANSHCDGFHRPTLPANSDIRTTEPDPCDTLAASRTSLPVAWPWYVATHFQIDGKFY